MTAPSWHKSEQVGMCLVCAGPLVVPVTGRPRLYCSSKCRQKAYRVRSG